MRDGVATCQWGERLASKAPAIPASLENTSSAALQRFTRVELVLLLFGATFQADSSF